MSLIVGGAENAPAKAKERADAEFSAEFAR